MKQNVGGRTHESAADGSLSARRAFDRRKWGQAPEALSPFPLIGKPRLHLRRVQLDSSQRRIGVYLRLAAVRVAGSSAGSIAVRAFRGRCCCCFRCATGSWQDRPLHSVRRRLIIRSFRCARADDCLPRCCGGAVEQGRSACLLVASLFIPHLTNNRRDFPWPR